MHGGVQKPGKFEYKNGDLIIDAVTIAGGYHPDAVVDSISLIRTDIRNITKSTYLTNEEAKNIFIKSEDHIMVPFSYNEDPHNIVEIIGEVNYPGTYPIDIGQTTINDIIDVAGGFLSSGNQNVIIGTKAGFAVTTSSYEVIIGDTEILKSFSKSSRVLISPSSRGEPSV